MAKAPLHLRMANLRRMLDKLVPRDEKDYVIVAEKDEKRFYDFIRNNNIPIAIRGENGQFEAVLIEEMKGNDVNNYTIENTSHYYVLEVFNSYNKTKEWIGQTFQYYIPWRIGVEYTTAWKIEGT